ncbi:hypothetical protein [Ehrlichia ruminantium]|uniref:hypothetical protein n=1 Tax=Ehrlichia ruminantium TaxID=779 RepID=UPI001E2DE583|nr:hypothetical protein [Ehrlichia ruminantium]
MKYKSRELDISDNDTKSRVTYCSQSEYEYGKYEMETLSGKDGIEFLKSVYHSDSDDVGDVLKSKSTVSSTKMDQVTHQISDVQTIERDNVEGQQVMVKENAGVGVHYNHTETIIKTSLSFKSDVMVDTKDKSIEEKVVPEGDTIRINEKKRDVFVSASAQTDMKSNQVRLSGSRLEKPDERRDVTDTACTGSTKDKSVEEKVVPEGDTIRINEKKRDVFVSASAQTDMKSNQVRLSGSRLEKPDEKRDVTDTACTGSTKDKSIEEKVVPEGDTIRINEKKRDVFVSASAQTGDMKSDHIKLSGSRLEKPDERRDVTDTACTGSTKDKSVEEKVVPEGDTIRINEKKRDVFVSASAQTGDMKSNQVKLSGSRLEKLDERKDVTDTGCTGNTKDKSVEKKVVSEGTAIRDEKESSVARSVDATFNLQSGNVKDDKVKLSGVDLGKIEDSVLSASSCETTVKDNKPVICVGKESTFQLASSLDLVNTVEDSSRNTRGLSETCSLMLDFDRNGNPVYEEATSKLVPSFYPDNVIYHTKEKHCGVDLPQSEDQLYSCITNVHSQYDVTENSVSVYPRDLVPDDIKQAKQNEDTKQGAFIATGSTTAAAHSQYDVTENSVSVCQSDLVPNGIKQAKQNEDTKQGAFIATGSATAAAHGQYDMTENSVSVYPSDLVPNGIKQAKQNEDTTKQGTFVATGSATAAAHGQYDMTENSVSVYPSDLVPNGIKQAKQNEDTKQGAFIATGSVSAKLNIVDVVNLGEKRDIDEKVVKSSDCATADSVSNPVGMDKVQYCVPDLETRVKMDLVEDHHNMASMEKCYPDREVVEQLSNVTTCLVSSPVIEHRVHSVESVAELQVKIGPLDEGKCRDSVVMSSSFTSDTCLKDTGATMTVEEYGNKPSTGLCASRGDDSVSSMIGMGSYFIDKMICDIDTTVQLNNTFSTLEKRKKHFIDDIKKNNEKIFSNLVNIMDLIKETVGIQFFDTKSTDDISRYVMEQSSGVYDDVMSQMLIQDEKYLFKVFKHIIPVFAKIFFNNDPISSMEWKLVDELFSMRRAVLQDNVYFQRIFYCIVCACEKTAGAIKKIQSLSKQCDEIREKIKKCNLRQGKKKSALSKFTDHFSEKKEDLLCLLDKIEKELNLTKQVYTNLIAEKEALLTGDVAYIRYFVSRIVFDSWKFDDKAKQVIKNIKNLAPYVLRDVLYEEEKKYLGLVKCIVCEYTVFYKDIDDFLPAVQEYHNRRQSRSAAARKFYDQEIDGILLPMDTLEDVGDLVAMELGQNSKCNAH